MSEEGNSKYFSHAVLGQKWSQQNLICRKYISVYNLNTIESVMHGDVTDFQELIGGENHLLPKYTTHYWSEYAGRESVAM